MRTLQLHDSSTWNIANAVIRKTDIQAAIEKLTVFEKQTRQVSALFPVPPSLSLSRSIHDTKDSPLCSTLRVGTNYPMCLAW